MAQANKKMGIVKDIIFSAFSFLENQGYKPDFKIEKSTVFDLSMVVIYCNAQNKREIRINYYEGEVDQVTKYVFAVSITRQPYLSIKDHFSLDLYLKSIGKNDIFFSLENFEKSKIEFTLLAMATALKIEIPQIISGNEWLEGYYPNW